MNLHTSNAVSLQCLHTCFCLKIMHQNSQPFKEVKGVVSGEFFRIQALKPVFAHFLIAPVLQETSLSQSLIRNMQVMGEVAVELGGL